MTMRSRLAGLRNTWTDKSTGEVVESYTVVTLNADDHPLMSRMWKPDPNGPGEQEYRSLVSIDENNVEKWLRGTLKEATELCS